MKEALTGCVPVSASLVLVQEVFHYQRTVVS